MERFFFDTNVLIYAVDEGFPGERAKALELIDRHGKGGDGAISTQVLQEFYVAATRRLGLPAATARQHVRDFQMFDVVQITTELIEEAIDQAVLTQISFWDALIVVAAQTARCGVLYTEDLNDGQVIDGVKVTNPFRSG